LAALRTNVSGRLGFLAFGVKISFVHSRIVYLREPFYPTIPKSLSSPTRSLSIEIEYDRLWHGHCICGDRRAAHQLSPFRKVSVDTWIITDATDKNP
jgi:hypothetical protein